MSMNPDENGFQMPPESVAADNDLPAQLLPAAATSAGQGEARFSNMHKLFLQSRSSKCW